MSVLYITQNGICDHIGQSQVAPYVLGLAAQGHAIHVLSAEKPGQDALVARYQALFDQAGVRWTRVPYRSAPKVIGPALTQWQLERAARRIIADEPVHAVHCRSFPAALIGHRLKRSLGVPYLFDFRDFYADGGLTKGARVLRPLYARMKRMEGPMIRDAARVVCLTERARDLLVDWYLKDVPGAADRFTVIPCCADFRHFDPARVEAEHMAEARQRLGLADGQTVLLYLGSLGPDYLLPEMIRLFAALLDLRSDARFLFVSNNGRELVEAECRAQGVPADRIVFTSVGRDAVPTLIALATLSVVFIRADLSKAGCSPTKLAELFAMNVPVIANRGVGDMDRIVSPDRNGSTLLADFSSDAMRRAIAEVLEMRENGARAIRENSAEFDLPAGVAAYAKVYRELEAG
ncbi:MAG TPA: glycosyltransferase [Novosphingobium sp.]|nr:glycosyltransferase [Novosphingobium sp.]